MEVANVTQGALITSNGQSYIADKVTTNLLGFSLTQRQILSGAAALLLGYLLGRG